MIIRPAVKSDMKNVEKLLRLPELSTATGQYLSAKVISGYIDKMYFLVAEENKEVIGTIIGERLKNNGIMIWMFVVKKEIREKGVGSALLKKFENNMSTEKRDWAILYAPAKSIKSINFYKKRGYNKGKLHVEFLKFFKIGSDNRKKK